MGSIGQFRFTPEADIAEGVADVRLVPMAAFKIRHSPKEKPQDIAGGFSYQITEID